MGGVHRVGLQPRLMIWKKRSSAKNAGNWNRLVWLAAGTGMCNKSCAARPRSVAMTLALAVQEKSIRSAAEPAGSAEIARATEASYKLGPALTVKAL